MIIRFITAPVILLKTASLLPDILSKPLTVTKSVAGLGKTRMPSNSANSFTVVLVFFPIGVALTSSINA